MSSKQRLTRIEKATVQKEKEANSYNILALVGGLFGDKPIKLNLKDILDLKEKNLPIPVLTLELQRGVLDYERQGNI